MKHKDRRICQFDSTLLALVATLLVVRLGMVAGYPLIIRVMPAWVWTNNDGYETIAVNWMETGTFALQTDVPTAVRLPLYPGMIAVCYAVAGARSVSVMLVQALLSTATGYVLFRLAKSLFSRRAAVASLLLFILHPQANNFVFRCATETLFVFVTMMLVYNMVRYLQTHRQKELVVFALFLGLSLLMRQTFTLLAILCVPALILSHVMHQQNIQRLLRHIGVATATVIIVLAPWVTRNYLHSGHFPVLQTWVGQPLFQGTYVSKHLTDFLFGEKTVAELDQEALSMIREETSSFLGDCPSESRPVAREILADRYARRLAYARLREDPFSSIGRTVRNLFLVPVLQMTWRSTLILMVWNWPLLVLSIIGMNRCFCKERSTFFKAVPIIVVFGYLLVVHALVWPQARYVLPGLIPFSVFAGFTLSQFTGRSRSAGEGDNSRSGVDNPTR